MLMPKKLEKQKENQARKRKKGHSSMSFFSLHLSFPAGCAKGGQKQRRRRKESNVCEGRHLLTALRTSSRKTSFTSWWIFDVLIVQSFSPHSTHNHVACIKRCLGQLQIPDHDRFACSLLCIRGVESKVNKPLSPLRILFLQTLCVWARAL